VELTPGQRVGEVVLRRDASEWLAPAAISFRVFVGAACNDCDPVARRGRSRL